MLEYLIQLPCETLGPNVLGFLDLRDIIQFECASTSHKSQQFLKTILPYCPAIFISSCHENRFLCNGDCINWFNRRRCHVQLVKVVIQTLCEIDFEHSVLNNIAIYIHENTTSKDIIPLDNPKIKNSIIQLHIQGYQDTTVMKLMFNKLNSIGTHLKKLTIETYRDSLPIYELMSWRCPYLEILHLSTVEDASEYNVLENIAIDCPQIRILKIEKLCYNNRTSCDADMTAFAEKCLQLEELSLYSQQFTDQTVIILTQHCSRLKKLQLHGCYFTVTSLIALSERGLPLEELVLPKISIPSAEIATQCSHALSRIRQLLVYTYDEIMVRYALQYMTGLHELYLNSSVDHLLVPHLLQLKGHFVGLKKLTIWPDSSITAQLLSEFVALCPELHTFEVFKSTGTSDVVLVELARSCPYLQKVTLGCSEVTEEGVLILAAHCRQLREINLSQISVTEETVRQLAQHCRHLTKLCCNVFTLNEESVVRKWSWREIRLLRGFREC